TRGRICLIKDMFENERPARALVGKDIDRCLSCLSCMATCRSGVHYMHLVDHARRHIEETDQRTLADRILRNRLALVLPRPNIFRLVLLGARFVRPLSRLLPGPFAAMLRLAP